MARKDTEFKLLSSKLRTQVTVYEMEILVDDEKIRLDVTTLDGKYLFHTEIGTKISEQLNKRDKDRFKEFLTDF